MAGAGRWTGKATKDSEDESGTLDAIGVTDVSIAEVAASAETDTPSRPWVVRSMHSGGLKPKIMPDEESEILGLKVQTIG